MTTVCITDVNTRRGLTIEKKRRRRKRSDVLGFALLIALIATITVSSAQQEEDPPLEGHPDCPCLMSIEDGLPPIVPKDLTNELSQQLGDSIDLASYGIGCGRHNEFSAQCVSGDCVRQDVLPKQLDCDRSWCFRSFCFVNPNNCTLLNRRSFLFANSGRYYSYATCYDMDSFSQNKLLSSLQGKTLRVGLNSNSGGWTGAYAKDGQHFQGPISKWSGPAVSFVSQAAQVGHFSVALTPPPAILANKSREFFSPSQFDYCVYATALGYLDLCVADYTVTEERAASTDWILLGTEPLYLIVSTDEGQQSNLDYAISNIATIFQPFTLGAWLFMILLVIPVLGCLMVVHEYNHVGSGYPREEQVLVVQENGSAFEEEEHRVPLYQHVIKSVYITLLSVLHQSYEASVVTYGAKLNLLGVAFFILTIIAVYTANLAAILTQQALVTSVSSLEDALRLGYRICGERKNIQDLSFIYGMDDNSVFVVDPIEQGGDGRPGFNCANCKSRNRVFDYLDARKANTGDERYCHAAIAPLQDLEKLQANGNHCNKTGVGQPVRFVQSGMPVHEGVSREVIALLLKLKNDGIYDKLLFASRPDSSCPVNEGGEGSALSVAQLMGIWVVTFGFAILGLLVTWTRPCWLKRTSHKNGQVYKMRRHDQWGDAVHPAASCSAAENVALLATDSSSSSHYSQRQQPQLEPASIRRLQKRREPKGDAGLQTSSPSADIEGRSTAPLELSQEVTLNGNV